MESSSLASRGAWTLRPRKITEVVDLAGRLYGRNLLTLLRIMVPFALVAQAIFVVLGLSALPNGSFVHSGTLYVPLGASTSDYSFAQLIAALLEFLLIDVLALAAMFRVFSETMLGHPTSAGAAVRLAASRFWALLGVSLLRAILVVVGVFLLVIPGIWVYVVFSVAVPVLLLEQTGVGAAFGRSRELVKGRWWATFGTLLLWGVIMLIAEFAVRVLLGVIVNNAIHSPTAFVLIQALARFIPEVLFAPFGAAVVTAIYFDLRVRKEAFDIEVMANHLAQVDGRGPVTCSLGLGTSDGGDGTAGLGGDGGSGGVRDPFAGG